LASYADGSETISNREQIRSRISVNLRQEQVSVGAHTGATIRRTTQKAD
jgi:hypothetical protein